MKTPERKEYGGQETRDRGGTGLDLGGWISTGWKTLSGLALGSDLI